MAEKDALLQPVPQNLAGPFSARRLVLEKSWQLWQLESELKRVIQNTPDVSTINLESLEILFAMIRREIEENLPAYVCRRCVARPEPQCFCGGKAWLTQREQETPGAVKRLFGCEAELTELRG